MFFFMKELIETMKGLSAYRWFNYDQSLLLWSNMPYILQNAVSTYRNLKSFVLYV